LRLSGRRLNVGEREAKLSDTDPFNPRKFVLLLMVMTTMTMMMMMMMLMISSPQVVHGLLLSHEHVHYNVFIMEK
jgi:hypothetical protein